MRLILVWLFLSLPLNAAAFETTYWVWHRASALSSAEAKSLERQKVTTLYWHAASLKAEGNGWRMEGALQLPAKGTSTIATVPVLRLTPDGPSPLREEAASSVSEILLAAAHRTQATEVQIDFDCPDRRLPEYAAFLSKCRSRIAPIRLSATALAGWSRSPAFEKLQASVDRLMPMFYDLVPDAPSDVRAGRVLPLVDAPTLANQLHSWRGCRIPWVAGIPNFARITVFNREGTSRGHLRTWDWDAVCFNPALQNLGQPTPGVALLRAQSDVVLADTPITAGETIACRLPDLAHLGQTIGYAQLAGAAGVAIFRLPGEGAQGGWSLSQLDTVLRTQKEGEPEFKLRRTTHGLELINSSTSDLGPRLAGGAGPLDRGWQLEIESSSGAVFREASPGEFASVFGHSAPDSAEPKPVAIPLAQRLTYWFAALRAGESRQSGLLQLAPGTEVRTLRWRIPYSAKNSQWHPID